MVEPELALLVMTVAVILAIIHILSEKTAKFMERYHYGVLSFSGGTLIALNFLVLLPEVIRISDSANIFFLMLMGFIVFHLTEKFLYQHVKNKKQLFKELKELHDIGFFIDHFILGFVLVTILEINSTAGLLILIPVFLHTISSSISLEHIHEKAKTGVNKMILTLAPVIGVLSALVLEIDEEAQGAVLAFVLGMLIYIVNRDILPREGKGRIEFFLSGVGLVMLIWFAMRVL